MIDICPGCKKPARWYHYKGFNSSWHRLCSNIWTRGYDTALEFCGKENEYAGYPSADELYIKRCQPPFEIIK